MSRRGSALRRQVLALSVVSALVGVACSTSRSTGDEPPGSTEGRLMVDGRWWMTTNLDVPVAGSWCYDDNESNCRRYGRLYTWGAARRGCEALGDGWRLPTNDEWRRLAGHHGGVSDDSGDGGRAAFAALAIGGSSGFDARLGGGRAPTNEAYARLDAHGFYWTATESDATTAWFYNFGLGGRALHRHDDGDKARAFSVRCSRG